MIKGKIMPCIAIGTVIFPHSAPLAFAQVRTPLREWNRLAGVHCQSLMFCSHDGNLNHQSRHRGGNSQQAMLGYKIRLNQDWKLKIRDVSMADRAGLLHATFCFTKNFRISAYENPGLALLQEFFLLLGAMCRVIANVRTLLNIRHLPQSIGKKD